jgi:ADP-ribose pyrophosphatase
VSDEPQAKDDFTEHELAATTVYRGRLLQVREDTVRLPNGQRASREYVVHPGAAVILPLFEDGSVLLERQFRYPLRRHFYELPAGKLDSGEAPLVTAKRELREETGYEAEHWHHLCTLHPCVGYSDESIDLFLARGLSFHGHSRDVDEFLETLVVPLDKALAWVGQGRITEVKTILGLLWADRLGRGEPAGPL